MDSMFSPSFSAFHLELIHCLGFNRLELQGHATKNQDLLLASGAISLKGSDGMSAVDDDIQAAVSR